MDVTEAFLKILERNGTFDRVDGTDSAAVKAMNAKIQAHNTDCRVGALAFASAFAADKTTSFVAPPVMNVVLTNRIVDPVAKKEPHCITDRPGFDEVSATCELIFTPMLEQALAVEDVAVVVMDASAVSLCRDNNIPIVVFSIREQGNILKVLDGSGTSTVVTSEGN